MLSKSRWPRVMGALGASALVAAVVVGCSGSGASPTGIGPFATGVNAAALGSGPLGSGALASGGSGTINQISAKFDYRDRLITPLAHLYGKFLPDFVVVNVTNGSSSTVKVEVTTEITSLTDQSTDTLTIEPGVTKQVRQSPNLTPAAISSLDTEKQANVHVIVSYLDNGQPRTVLDQTATTTVSSRRDFPWQIQGMTEAQDFELLATMITPTDPKVEELITKAAKYDPDKVMEAGYQTVNDSDGSVKQRLADIWQAETTDYHLTYVSTTETFDGSSQRIRLPTEVLTGGSGNCIETSLLYAAAAEALDLEAVLVLIPGHAYMGVNLDGQGNNWYWVETTMIGRYGFADALKEGAAEFSDASPHIKAAESQYGLVNVDKARADGITPIPWS